MRRVSTDDLRQLNSIPSSRHTLPMKAHGIFSHRQLATNGWTKYAINAALNSGRLKRVTRGWYATASADLNVIRSLTHHGRLGCLSGCRFYGLWTPPTQALHVVYGSNQHPKHGKGILFHYTNHAKPCAPIWSLLDCLDQVLHRHSTEEALIVLESAVNLGLITITDARRICYARPTYGKPALRYLNRAESGSETRVRLFFQQRKVKVTPQVEIPGLGRVDMVVGDRLIIECDSQTYHSSPAQQERDRARDLIARDLGYDTIRLSYHQIWTTWETTQQSLLRELRRRRHLTR